ncbi:MAG: hypothetical protein GVY26_15230 [Bacteroidetes bacterium]|jgi:uncharacterized protein involved in cysteine biosynthesis|nr:hypothetical protein [Bacteroidota bacterium]
MLTALTIVIGLIFVLLLFSLLASTVMEVIASLFSLRARNLRHTLDTMLGEKADDFIRHPLFRQLAYATNRRNRPSALSLPSYVSKETFLSIFMDILGSQDRKVIADNIASMDEGDLKRLMQYLYRQSGGQPSQFKKKAGMWFDEVMNRASEWYTRRTKYLLFVVGLVLAFLFNVDTIQIYQSISSSATIQQQLLSMASQFAEQRDTIGGIDRELALEESMTRLNDAWNQFEYNASPLGLGWGSGTAEEGRSIPDWLVKIAGFLLSAIAVTFGAPFWFDLLKKLLNLRGGTAETKEEEPEEPENQAVAAVAIDTPGEEAAPEEPADPDRPVG